MQNEKRESIKMAYSIHTRFDLMLSEIFVPDEEERKYL